MATPKDEKKVVYNFLGRSGMKVSNICLGCVTFGQNSIGFPGYSDEDASHQILNRFSEWGGNFLDTANSYGHGTSETIIGKWLERQPREKYVIATKVRFNMGTEQNVNNLGLSRRHITDSIDLSLERLHTDYVDLYQTHEWDDGTPLEETFRTLDDLVRVGKVRYLGVSNVTGWQMQKLVDTCDRLGLNQVVSVQQQYSLVNRESELEAFQVCKQAGIAVLPWSPLKGGLLAGKVRRGVKPTEGRLGWAAASPTRDLEISPHWSKFDDKTFQILDCLQTVAQSHNRSVPQVAICWLLQKDLVPSVVIGARTLSQLEDNMGAAAGWSLTRQEMNELDQVSSSALPYPYSMAYGLNADRVNPFLPQGYVKSLDPPVSD